MPSNAKFIPNQKVIRSIHKEPCNKDNLYTQFNIKAFEDARRELDPNGFIVWTYIAQNASSYTFGLSKSDFTKRCGVSAGIYDRGVKNLVDKGYLVETEDSTKSKPIFDFFEVSQKREGAENSST